MSEMMPPVPQEEYNHAQAMKEHEAAQQASRLEVFPRVAAFMASPDSEFAAGPDIRKATGLSHHDITVGLGYGSFSELKQDSATWKQEQDAKAAKDAELAESRAKEQTYQDEMNVYRELRNAGTQKVEDLVAGRRPMTYREKLIAGGERGVKLLEESRSMTREDAIGAAAVIGYSVGHLIAEKVQARTSPAAEERAAKNAAAAKRHDAAVLAAQGTPRTKTSKAPTPEKVSAVPDYLAFVPSATEAMGAVDKDLPFFMRDQIQPEPAVKSARELAESLVSGAHSTPEDAAQLYNLIAIHPDGKSATILVNGESMPFNVDDAKKIQALAKSANEQAARKAVIEATVEPTVLSQEQAKKMALEAVGASPVEDPSTAPEGATEQPGGPVGASGKTRGVVSRLGHEDRGSIDFERHLSPKESIQDLKEEIERQLFQLDENGKEVLRNPHFLAQGPTQMALLKGYRSYLAAEQKKAGFLTEQDGPKNVKHTKSMTETQLAKVFRTDADRLIVSGEEIEKLCAQAIHEQRKDIQKSYAHLHLPAPTLILSGERSAELKKFSDEIDKHDVEMIKHDDELSRLTKPADIKAAVDAYKKAKDAKNEVLKERLKFYEKEAANAELDKYRKRLAWEEESIWKRSKPTRLIGQEVRRTSERQVDPNGTQIRWLRGREMKSQRLRRVLWKLGFGQH